MIASITQSAAPRGARFLTTAARQSIQPVAATTTATQQQAAKITTTAASIGNPGPSASQKHVVSRGGSLKSAHRHFHANGSESASGLNEMNIASAREASRMFRMKEAKELAGL